MLCDIKRDHKSLEIIISFVKKFVNKNNTDIFVVYTVSDVIKNMLLGYSADYDIPISIVDTYEWGQEPAFVLVVTDEEKSPVESIVRHHYADKTFAVITMMLCKND